MEHITQEEIIEYCMSKPGAFLDFPFGADCAVVKVKAARGPSRIFAQVFTLKGIPKATFNCDVLTGIMYREGYPGIVVRGYHCPPVQQPYFNTVDTESQPAEIITGMIDHSYRTVLSKLPKYAQKELVERKGQRMSGKSKNCPNQYAKRNRKAVIRIAEK